MHVVCGAKLEEVSKMRCFMCKGHLVDKLTNFLADLGECIVIVKNVPAQVCTQCGEVSYSNEVARKLEETIKFIRRSSTEIAVIHYDANKVA